MLPRLFLFALILLTSFCVTADNFSLTLKENSQWDELFTQQEIKGVFVLCKRQNQAQQCTTNNKNRAEQSFIPASTFKIPNALIALETQVIKDPKQIFYWDKKPRMLKSWQQDLNLRGAIQYSAVPIFQQFAMEIGHDRMKTYLQKFNYGNTNIDGGIDRFWLDGGLRISALNQVDFLQALYENKLPISVLNQMIVKDALTIQASPKFILRAKTGYTGVTGNIQPGIAWWVGIIETGVEVYTFAFNMDISDASKLSARETISRTIMQQEGVLPESE